MLRLKLNHVSKRGPRQPTITSTKVDPEAMSKWIHNLVSMNISYFKYVLLTLRLCEISLARYWELSRRTQCWYLIHKGISYTVLTTILPLFSDSNQIKEQIWSALSPLGGIYWHDDVIKWKHFPRCWPFVWGIHQSRWLPRTKASDAELWCFLWSAPELTIE